MLHVLGLEMTFWCNFIMILHGFSSRKPGNTLKPSKNKYLYKNGPGPKQTTKIKNNALLLKHWGRHCSDRARITPVTDCSLRQGAGGREFARLGSRTWFLMRFLKRSEAYLGQKPEEHYFLIKKTLSEGQKYKKNELLKEIGVQKLTFWWNF